MFDKFAVRKYEKKLVEMRWEDLVRLRTLARIYGDVVMNLLPAHYSTFLVAILSFAWRNERYTAVLWFLVIDAHSAYRHLEVA